jgi:5-methylthioadenosine/S-adenosylhomocysteine deaminase
MYFAMDQTARAVEESGLRAALTYGMIDLGNREKADAELREGTRFAREWDGKAGGRITTMYGPHAPNTCSKEFLERILDRARGDGSRLHIHLLETEAERVEIRERYGVGALGLLDDIGFLGSDLLAAHGVWITEDEMDILGDRGVHISHNPVSNMKLASGVASVAAMLDAGVSVSLGTDGCASNNNLDLFEEMKTAALLQKAMTGDPTVLPARQVLEMATVNGAKALGIDSGMLRKGMNADVIVINMNQPHLLPVFDVPSQLVYAASGRDVAATIVGGRILMENREVKIVDEERVLAQMVRLSRGLPFQ